jgi:hypothetical protein
MDFKEARLTFAKLTEGMIDANEIDLIERHKLLYRYLYICNMESYLGHINDSVDSLKDALVEKDLTYDLEEIKKAINCVEIVIHESTNALSALKKDEIY